MEQAEFLGQKVVQASLEGREQTLTDWFGRTLKHASAVEIQNIAAPPPGSGFSAENYFLDVAWQEAGASKQQRFVLRRMSSGRLMFPDRDFGAERKIQEVVGALGASPVPQIVGFEDDPAVLGERFYVMNFIEGEVPPTNPSHHEGGMLAERSADDRRALWLNALQDLGRLHRNTHARPELERFAKDGDGRSEFTHALDYWKRHYALGAGDKPLPLMGQVEAWLRAHEPAERNRAVCWGDARLGNAVFDSRGRCVGFFDWELFSLGDPVRDLAYWLYTDDHFIYASGKKLEAWPDHEKAIAAYEQGAGYKVDRDSLAFHRIYQGYHIVSTLTRLIQIKKEAGQMPPDLEIGPHFTPVSYLQQEWEKLL